MKAPNPQKAKAAETLNNAAEALARLGTAVANIPPRTKAVILALAGLLALAAFLLV